MKRELYRARTKWRSIGLELDVDPSDLDDIEHQHKVAEGNSRCLEEMLRKAHPTVKSLLTALREVTVGEEGLADEIEKKYQNLQRGEPAASEFVMLLI